MTESKTTEVLSPKGGNNGNNVWYNPIGITIKNGDNSTELKKVVESVKKVLSNDTEFKNYNLDSPSDLAKAMIVYIIRE